MSARRWQQGNDTEGILAIVLLIAVAFLIPVQVVYCSYGFALVAVVGRFRNCTLEDPSLRRILNMLTITQAVQALSTLFLAIAIWLWRLRKHPVQHSPETTEPDNTSRAHCLRGDWESCTRWFRIGIAVCLFGLIAAPGSTVTRWMVIQFERSRGLTPTLDIIIAVFSAVVYFGVLAWLWESIAQNRE